MMTTGNHSALASADPRDRSSALSRRAFVHGGALFMAGSAFEVSGVTALAAVEAPAARPVLRIGLLTDPHYADKPPAGTRYYRESMPKIAEGITRFNASRLDFAVELGDFIDAADTVKGETRYLETIDAAYAKLSADRHYVFGNHCCWMLTKQQFLDHCAARKPFYSFDRRGFHFVVLDACYRADGVSYGNRNFDWKDTEIPPAEREWLRADLAATKNRTVVFVHQRLDVANHYGVKSAPAVRKILAESGRVLAVFQGHNHINDYHSIGGIHYCTLAAMVEGSGKENSAYGVVDIHADGSIRVDGFRKQKDYAWSPRT